MVPGQDQGQAAIMAKPKKINLNTAIASKQGERRTISEEQRVKLRAAQLAYVANDPRWAEHRRKLAAAQEARRMTLFDNEVTAIVEMRKKGRTFSYISEEIGVCRDVITRELAALGHSIEGVKADRRAHRGEVAGFVETLFRFG